MIAAAVVLVALTGLTALLALALAAVDAVLDADEPRDEYEIDRLMRWLAMEGALLLEAERRHQ